MGNKLPTFFVIKVLILKEEGGKITVKGVGISNKSKEEKRMAKQIDVSKDMIVSRKVVEEMVTEGMPKVVAKFSLGFTINLQNYESCKIEAGIELEGTIDNLEKLQAQAQDEVEKIIGEQLSQLKEKDPRITLLGFRG